MLKPRDTRGARRFSKTILQFFLDVVEGNVIMFEQKLLGARGIDTRLQTQKVDADSVKGRLTRELSVLRLYPSVPVNSREAVRTTTLLNGGGPDGRAPLLVRKGEALAYCVYAMNRRRDIYGEDADESRPERWEGDALKIIGWAYLPFNGGPRLRLGRRSTLSIAEIVIMGTLAKSIPS